jgi:putative ABC transport system ATP-binding protein
MVLLSASGLSVPAPPGAAADPLPGPVDLDLASGELLGVRGPSGAGKTTLLRCLALLEPRATGEVRFRDAPVPPAHTPAFRRAVVYLPQQPPPVPMTVAASLAQPFSFKSAGDGAYDAAVAGAMCRRLGLPGDVLDRWVPDLSAGEAQRVSLVRALLVAPDVLLLDEFTSALDPASREAAEALVSEWRTAGERAAVLVSHDAAQNDRMTSRSLALSRDASAGGGK